MVRRTKAKKAKTKAKTEGIDWITVEGQYRANLISIRGIARLYNISDSGIRKRALEHNWSRDPNATKKEIVRAAMAGKPPDGDEAQTSNLSLQNKERTKTVASKRVQPQVAVNRAQPARSGNVATANMIAGAALEDIRDMRAGLHNARRILEVANQYLDTQFELDPHTNRMVDPRYLKAVADASASAIDQIRKIRELDSRIPDELEALKLLVNAGWMPDELLTAAFQEYRAFKPSMRGVFQQHFKTVMTASADEEI